MENCLKNHKELARRFLGPLLKTILSLINVGQPLAKGILILSALTAATAANTGIHKEIIVFGTRQSVLVSYPSYLVQQKALIISNEEKNIS